MAKLSALFPFIFLLVAGDLTIMVKSELQQILKQGERLRVGFSKKFQDGKCRVAMKARGSLVVLKKKEEMELMWQTGIAPGHVREDEYKLQLRQRGNMVIKRFSTPDGPREPETVYDTHTEGDVGNYFLGINEYCVLGIFEGTLDIPGKLVWSNIKAEVNIGDSLGVSEIFSYIDLGAECDHFMFMSPGGNLEIYQGRDFTDAVDKEPVWESGTRRKRGDYRFGIDEYAVLSLLDVTTGEQYWRKDLRNSGRPKTIMYDLMFQLVSFGCGNSPTPRIDNGVGPYAYFHNDELTVFMREGDRLPAGSNYGNNFCNLFVQYDGRLDADNYIKTRWTSGKARDDTIYDDYFLMLHETGNLAMYRGTIDNPERRVWATHTRGDVGNYFLMASSLHCDLELYEGTPEEPGDLLWTNIANQLKPGDRFTKGQQYYRVGACGSLILRPDTGVLEIHSAGSMVCGSIYEKPECFENPGWHFDAGLGEYDDFYMEVGEDAKLRFYGVAGDGDKLMDDVFDLGDNHGGNFEVALCDENDVALPNAIPV